MPFGIPCDSPPIDELIRSLTSVNTSVGNIVYNVIFPVGQRLTIAEKILGQSHKAMAQKVRQRLNRTAGVVSSALEDIAGAITERISSNGAALAQAQNAIALTPMSYSPDVPAADIRIVPPTKPQQEAIALVSNTIRQADADVNSLLSLLYLLNITPAQVRRYLTRGTIPDVYLCPNPNAHAPETMAPEPEILQAVANGQVALVTDPLAAKPDVDADGFWED